MKRDNNFTKFKKRNSLLVMRHTSEYDSPKGEQTLFRNIKNVKRRKSQISEKVEQSVLSSQFIQSKSKLVGTPHDNYGQSYSFGDQANPSEESKDSLMQKQNKGKEQNTFRKRSLSKKLPKQGQAVQGNIENSTNHIINNLTISRQLEGNQIITKKRSFNQIFDEDDGEHFIEKLSKQRQAIEHFIKNSTSQQKLQRAVKHLREALFIIAPNSNLDFSKHQLLIKMHELATNQLWKIILILITLSFCIQIFFEPSSEYDTESDIFNSVYLWIVIQEPIIIAIYLFDTLITSLQISIVQKPILKNEKKIIQIINKISFIIRKNIKFIIKMIIWAILFSDCIIFYSYYPQYTLRFSRILRPLWLFFYSQDLRQILIAIVKSVRRAIDIFLFFLIISMFWAYMGYNLFSELQQDNLNSNTNVDNDFDTYGKSLIAMYSLISFDNYPNIFIDIVDQSYWYLIFFIPYSALMLFFILPIPVSIIFQQYKQSRAELLLQDRMKIKEALFSCFICLDEKCENKLDYKTFFNLIDEFYNHKAIPDRVQTLFENLDIDQDGFVNLEDFLDLYDMIMNNEIIYDNSYKLWDVIRYICNKYFFFQDIAHSTIWSSFILIIVMLNTVVVIAYSMIQDEAILNQLDGFETFFNCAYIIDVVIKLIGLGIDDFFSDFWCQFDFWMVFISIITMVGLQYIYFLKKAKSGKLLKITKLQRVLRIFRSIRSVKIMKIFYYGADTLNRLKVLLQKVAVCFPVVYKMVASILLIIYFYAIIGMELFNTSTQSYHLGSPYSNVIYSDFNSLASAMLTLFQVCTQSGWINLMNDYGYKFSYEASAIFFISFHMIIILFLYSLLQGLIWDVFNVVDIHFQEQEHYYASCDVNEIEEPIYDKDDIDSINSSSQIESNNLSPTHVDSSPYKIKVNNKLKPINEEEDDNEHDYSVELKIENERSQICQVYDLQGQITNRNNLQDRTKPDIPESLFQETDQPLAQQLSGQRFLNQNTERNNMENLNDEQQQCPEKRSLSIKLNLYDQSNVVKSLQSFISNSDENIQSPSNLVETQKKQISNNHQEITTPEIQVRAINIKENQENVVDKAIEKEFYSNLFTPLSNDYQSLDRMIKSHPNINQNVYIINEEGDQNCIKFTQSQIKAVEMNNSSGDEEQMKDQEIQERKRKKEKQMSKITITNSSALMKLTYLNSYKKDQLDTMEKNYFQNIYGNMYDKLKTTNMFPTYQLQNNLLMILKRLLRYSNVPEDYFVRKIQSIEKQISKKLLKQGSFIKILFQMNNEWYCLQKNEDKQIKFIEASSGFWKYSSNFLNQETQIYFGKDAFQSQGSQEFYKYQSVIKRQVNEYTLLSQGISDFLKIYNSNINNIWNIFCFNFKNQNQSYLTEALTKKFKIDYKCNAEQLQLISQFQFDTIMVITVTAQRGKKHIQNYSNNDDGQEQLLSNTDLPHSSPKGGSQKLIFDYNNHQKNQISDNDNVEFLNLAGYLELLKDLRDIIYLYKENLIFKISESYFTNFLNIRNISEKASKKSKTMFNNSNKNQNQQLNSVDKKNATQIQQLNHNQ